MRLAGFEWIDAGPDGGDYVAGAAPWRGIVHATQSRNVDAAVAAYRDKGTPPHVTADPWARRRAQHVDTDRSSYAVKNLPGGVETNRLRAFQIELVGFSEDPRNLSPTLAPYSLEALDDDDKRWLGEQVFRPIMAACPIKPIALTMYGADCGWTLARADARQRLTFDAWTHADYWVGHQHVPENDHWDPGQLDLDTILRYAAPATSEEDEPMPIIPSWAKLTGGRWPAFDVVDRAAHACTVTASPGAPFAKGLDKIPSPKFTMGSAFGLSTCHIDGLPSAPRGLAEAPDGSIVLVCQGGETYGVAVRP